MFTIFDEGHGAETVGAAAGGGLLTSAYSRSDLARFIEFCLSLRNAPPPVRFLASGQQDDLALRHLYADLLAGGPSLARQEPSASPLEPRWRSQLDELSVAGAKDTFEGLILALAALFDIWDEPNNSEPQTRLLLAIARPALPASESLELTFEAPSAALVVQPGSLLARFAFERSIKGKGWIAAVVASGARLFIGPQAAGERLVEGARERAKSQGARYILPRLDRLDPREAKTLGEGQLVLIFLHGLFSTDVGTFDGLIDELRAKDPLMLAARLKNAADAFPEGLEGRPEALLLGTALNKAIENVY